MTLHQLDTLIKCLPDIVRSVRIVTIEEWADEGMREAIKYSLRLSLHRNVLNNRGRNLRNITIRETPYGETLLTITALAVADFPV